jgi:hypothetical protein
VILTEHQLELLRALQFHGGNQIVRSLTEKAAYGKLADAGYVIATHLSHGDMHFALTHNGRAVLNSLND